MEQKLQNQNPKSVCTALRDNPELQVHRNKQLQDLYKRRKQRNIRHLPDLSTEFLLTGTQSRVR